MTTRDDATLAELGHLNLMEFSRESARWSGAAGAIAEDSGILLFASGTTFPVSFNGVFRLDTGVDAATLVERAELWFAGLGRGYTLWVRDADADADLAKVAEEADLVPILTSPEMVCDAPIAAAPLPAGAELRWVEDATGIADFCAVNAGAYATYGLPESTIGEIVVSTAAFLAPHLRSVVAYLDGRAVAAAQVLLSHGIAGVYWVGTVDDARGRGLGEAVTRAVTNLAFELGAATVTLQASPMGEPIYARMGYRTLHGYRGCVRFRG